MKNKAVSQVLSIVLLLVFVSILIAVFYIVFTDALQNPEQINVESSINEESEEIEISMQQVSENVNEIEINYEDSSGTDSKKVLDPDRGESISLNYKDIKVDNGLTIVAKTDDRSVLVREYVPTNPENYVEAEISLKESGTVYHKDEKATINYNFTNIGVSKIVNEKTTFKIDTIGGGNIDKITEEIDLDPGETRSYSEVFDIENNVSKDGKFVAKASTSDSEDEVVIDVNTPPNFFVVDFNSTRTDMKNNRLKPDKPLSARQSGYNWTNSRTPTNYTSYFEVENIGDQKVKKYIYQLIDYDSYDPQDPNRYKIKEINIDGENEKQYVLNKKEIELTHDKSVTSGKESVNMSFTWSNINASDEGIGRHAIHIYTGNDTTFQPVSVRNPPFHKITIRNGRFFKPIARFNYNPSEFLDTDDTINFDASPSTDRDGNITSYEWDFGDGSTSVGKKPSHSYSSSGTYDVTLTVTDDDNKTGTATARLDVSDGGGGGRITPDSLTPTSSTSALSADSDSNTSQTEFSIEDDPEVRYDVTNIGGMIDIFEHDTLLKLKAQSDSESRIKSKYRTNATSNLSIANNNEVLIDDQVIENDVILNRSERKFFNHSIDTSDTKLGFFNLTVKSEYDGNDTVEIEIGPDPETVVENISYRNPTPRYRDLEIQANVTNIGVNRTETQKINLTAIDKTNGKEHPDSPIIKTVPKLKYEKSEEYNFTLTNLTSQDGYDLIFTTENDRVEREVNVEDPPEYKLTVQRRRNPPEKTNPQKKITDKEAVLYDYKIENIGYFDDNRPGDKEVKLRMDGKVVNSITQPRLNSGQVDSSTIPWLPKKSEGDGGAYNDTLTVTNTWASPIKNDTVDPEGELRVKEPFTIKIATIDRNPVVEGGTVPVTVIAENTGPLTTQEDVSLQGGIDSAVNENLPIDKSFTISGNSSKSKTYQLSTQFNPGSYNIVASGEYSPIPGNSNRDAASLTVLDDANFVIKSVSINSPTEGDDVVVTVEVKNNGDVRGTKSLEVNDNTLPGSGTKSTTVSLNPGSTKTKAFSFGTSDGDNGNYELDVETPDDSVINKGFTVNAGPNFVMSNDAVNVINDPVTNGTDINVEVTVRNNGGAFGTETLSVEVVGIGTKTETVSLGSGSNTDKSFSFSTSDGDQGTSDVIANIDGDTESSSVEVK